MKNIVLYTSRRYILLGMIIFVASVFLIKLFYMQVISDKYKRLSELNSVRYVYEYPARGLIYDRYGHLLVFNKASFDIMVVPGDIEALDTSKLLEILSISKDEFLRRLNKAKKYSRFTPSVFEANINEEVYSKFQEKKYLFKGFYIQGRTIRVYPYVTAPHLLGYLGEVSSQKLEEDKYYQPGEYIGISGLEEYYEKELRGVKGLRVMEVDVHNRIKGSYRNGELDKKPIPGKDLYTTIDLDLQMYGEKLMQNKRGAIVAIEPQTGEVLAMVSSPFYDPNLLVGRERSNNYLMLMKDSVNHPLYNRAIMTKYPPGSVFKVVNALAALQMKFIERNTSFSCYGSYPLGKDHDIDCHVHPSPLNLPGAIQYSCNTYFCYVFKKFVDNSQFSSSREGYAKWKEYINKMGFGHPLGIDLPNEFGGNVADVSYYDRMKGTKNWYANSIMSVAIGQGEIGATPLQLANLACIIANKGYYIIPHVVRAIGSPDSLLKFPRVDIGIDSALYIPVIEGMELAVLGGTARVAQIPNISVCGKTGTAQDPPRKNHSVFIAFAPKNKPRIAIAVLVENSGFGAEWAAPIASLMIEYFLNRKITRKDLEQKIINAKLLNPYL
ncbi:MAG: penicillin-binding protein 2 [Bacteroidales bacterium]|nr:penicillin-binding protein 2 [Bacteroidales bacterium]